MAKTLASAILASIIGICEIKDQKEGESRQDFLMRCVKSMNGLSDKDWEELPKDAQAWFNGAADVAEANKKSDGADPLPDFPDLPKAEEEKTGSRRRASSSDDDGSVVKVGRHVTVVTRRGKEVSGEVVEYDKKTIVVKDKDGEEHEFDVEPLKEVRVHNDGAKPEQEQERGPRAGDEVSFTTKRGRAVSGTLVELTGEDVLVKTSEGDEEFMLSRIEGEIKFGGGKAAAKDDPKDEPASTRRGASAKDKDEPKAPRVVNKGGVSVGQRCKELVAADPDLTLDGVKKALKADGIEYKDVTVEMNYTELSKFVAELRKNKKLK